MKLTDMQVKEFINVLASDAPAPGGGSASALAGAMGVGLAKMVASLTLGKAKYAEQLHTPYVLHTGDFKEEDGITFLPLYMTPLL